MMRVSTQTRKRLEAKGIEFLVEGTKKPANSCVEDFKREAFMRSNELYAPVGRDRLAHVVAERFNIPLEEAEDMVQIESMKITLPIISFAFSLRI
jgi:hypothetical protein